MSRGPAEASWSESQAAGWSVTRPPVPARTDVELRGWLRERLRERGIALPKAKGARGLAALLRAWAEAGGVVGYEARSGRWRGGAGLALLRKAARIAWVYPPPGFAIWMDARGPFAHAVLDPTERVDAEGRHIYAPRPAPRPATREERLAADRDAVANVHRYLAELRTRFRQWERAGIPLDTKAQPPGVADAELAVIVRLRCEAGLAVRTAALAHGFAQLEPGGPWEDAVDAAYRDEDAAAVDGEASTIRGHLWGRGLCKRCGGRYGEVQAKLCPKGSRHGGTKRLAERVVARLFKMSAEALRQRIGRG